MTTELESVCAELITVRETIKGLKEREEALRTLTMQKLEDLEEGPFETNGYRFTLGTHAATLGWNLEELQSLLPPERLRDIAKITFKESDMKKLAKTQEVDWDIVLACKFKDKPKLSLSVRKMAERPPVFGELEK